MPPSSEMQACQRMQTTGGASGVEMVEKEVVGHHVARRLLKLG